MTLKEKRVSVEWFHMVQDRVQGIIVVDVEVGEVLAILSDCQLVRKGCNTSLTQVVSVEYTM